MSVGSIVSIDLSIGIRMSFAWHTAEQRAGRSCRCFPETTGCQCQCPQDPASPPPRPALSPRPPPPHRHRRRQWAGWGVQEEVPVVGVVHHRVGPPPLRKEVAGVGVPEPTGADPRSDGSRPEGRRSACIDVYRWASPVALGCTSPQWEGRGRVCVRGAATRPAMTHRAPLPTRPTGKKGGNMRA